MMKTKPPPSHPGQRLAGFVLLCFFLSGLNWAQAKENIDYAHRSRHIDLAYPELLTLLIVSEDLGRLFGPGPVNTQDQPLLEYAAPKLMRHGEESQQTLLRQLAHRAWVSDATRSEVQRLTRSVDAQIDFAAYALKVHSPGWIRLPERA